MWATDYVLADYGTGAVMGVPGGDQRDWEFATEMGLRIIRTTEPPADFEGEAFYGEGPAINSPAAGTRRPAGHQRAGRRRGEARHHRVPGGAGHSASGAVNFRLRDWLLSRQRYWGAPIPIIHCPVDGEVAVPEDQLPVELPELRGADLKPKGVSPLGGGHGLGRRRLPDLRWAGEAGHRHDGHLRRLVLVHVPLLLAERRHPAVRLRRWSTPGCPCDIYVGGDEHAVLHLLYARFFTKALRDMGLVDFGEPFSAYLSQGKVINNGRKMSKSLGNGVSLGDQLAEYGVDAVRLTLVFAGPPEDDIDWADMSPAGSLRFLQRAWRLAGDVTVVARRRPGGRRRWRCARSPTGRCTRPRSWSSRTAST